MTSWTSSLNIFCTNLFWSKPHHEKLGYILRRTQSSEDCRLQPQRGLREIFGLTKTSLFVSSLFYRNLLANPFNCNCHLAWLGDWLRRKRIVTGNPRCQSPYFLKEIPIQDVAVQDFACEDGEIQ